MNAEQFIQNLPKAELHLHIEGTFEPELMFAIAQRNNIDLPYRSVEQLREAYNFSNLQDFLDIYYQGMNVLRTQRDFYELTRDYLARAHTQGVRHVEIFFDPQGHVSRGISFETVLDGLHQALTESEAMHGISFHIIMCFLRHLDQDDAFKTLDMAMPYRDRIIGVGLDSSERGNPPEKFTGVFAAARQAGFRCVAHAGEEGPADYVRQALDQLQIERIDHGNAALDDPALVNYLAKQQIALTVCPLSNLKLCVVDSVDQHPLPTMLRHNLCITLNSDDPAYFGGYINENYQVMQQAFSLDIDTLATLAKNSFTASFASQQRINTCLDAVDDYLKQCNQ